jgi:hypothetical protein
VRESDGVNHPSNLPVVVEDAQGVGGRGRISLKPLTDRLAAAITGPLDRAFDEVFERHLDVRSVDHAEEMLSVISARDKASANVGTWLALAASLRPMVLRVVRGARATSKVARFSGAGRLALWGVTATVAAGRTVETAKVGVSELQIMAAYLASRIRARGHLPSQDAVELAVLSLYTKPGRRVDLRQPRRTLLSAAARRWVLDAFRPDAEDSRRRRARARLRAVEELSDAELLQLVEVIDVVDVADVGTNGAVDAQAHRTSVPATVEASGERPRRLRLWRRS